MHEEHEEHEGHEGHEEHEELVVGSKAHHDRELAVKRLLVEQGVCGCKQPF